MDGGNGPADGIVEECGTADTKIVNDISLTVTPETKKEIVLVSKDVLKKMIELLTNEDTSDNSPVDHLRNLVPYEEFFLKVAGTLDDNMIYVDDAVHAMTISELVNRTFESFTVSVEGNIECTTEGRCW